MLMCFKNGRDNIKLGAQLYRNKTTGGFELSVYNDKPKDKLGKETAFHRQIGKGSVFHLHFQ